MDWLLAIVFGIAISLVVSWVVNRFNDLENRIKHLGSDIEQLESDMDELKEAKKS